MKDLLIQERAEKKHIFKYFIVCHGCLLALLWVTHEESLYGYLKPCRCICSVSCLGLSSNDFYAFISLAGDFFSSFFHSTCFLRDVGRAGLDFPCNLVCDRCLSIFKFQLMVHADVIWKEKKNGHRLCRGKWKPKSLNCCFFSPHICGCHRILKKDERIPVSILCVFTMRSHTYSCLSQGTIRVHATANSQKTNSRTIKLKKYLDFVLARKTRVAIAFSCEH